MMSSHKSFVVIGVPTVIFACSTLFWGGCKSDCEKARDAFLDCLEDDCLATTAFCDQAIENLTDWVDDCEASTNYPADLIDDLHCSALFIPCPIGVDIELDDGRLLLPGGNFPPMSGQPFFLLYDVPTGDEHFEYTDTPFYQFTRTVQLDDGRFLRIAGTRNNTATDLVIRHDANGQHWTRLAPLQTPRAFHTATVLGDGRVMVAGGSESEREPELASVELFEPITETWELGPPMTEARDRHTATMLATGDVLAVGGWRTTGDYSGTGLTSVERFDPETNTWFEATPMHDPRYLHTATLLDDGRVLVLGGFPGDSRSATDSAELYDPQTDEWMSLPPLENGRAGHATTVMPDGRIIVSGGYGPVLDRDRFDITSRRDVFLSSVEWYEPITGGVRVAQMITARQFHDAIVVDHQILLLVGGTLFWGDEDPPQNCMEFLEIP